MVTTGAQDLTAAGAGAPAEVAAGSAALEGFPSILSAGKEGGTAVFPAGASAGVTGVAGITAMEGLSCDKADGFVDALISSDVLFSPNCFETAASADWLAADFRSLVAGRLLSPLEDGIFRSLSDDPASVTGRNGAGRLGEPHFPLFSASSPPVVTFALHWLFSSGDFIGIGDLERFPSADGASSVLFSLAADSLLADASVLLIWAVVLMSPVAALEVGAFRRGEADRCCRWSSILLTGDSSAFFCCCGFSCHFCISCLEKNGLVVASLVLGLPNNFFCLSVEFSESDSSSSMLWRSSRAAVPQPGIVGNGEDLGELSGVGSMTVKRCASSIALRRFCELWNDSLLMERPMCDLQTTFRD